MLFVELSHLGQLFIKFCQSFLEPRLDERGGQLRRKAGEQQELTAVLVIAKRFEQRCDKGMSAGRRDRIDLLGGLAILLLHMAGDEIFRLKLGQRRIDRTKARVDEVGIVPLHRELSDFIPGRHILIENGKADRSDVHGVLSVRYMPNRHMPALYMPITNIARWLSRYHCLA